MLVKLVKQAVAEGVEKMRAQIAATRARPTVDTLDHYASVAATFAVEAFVAKVDVVDGDGPPVEDDEVEDTDLDTEV